MEISPHLHLSSLFTPAPASRSRAVIGALLEDLQPTPGRLAGALRIVIASVIALLLMETLQMPFISIGMYFIFLIARDSPAVSLRSACFSLGIVLLAIVVEFGVVILSDNDPIARLLSVAVVTFIAGMIVAASNQPALGSSFGLIYCTVISLWEVHAPADYLVKTSLYLVGTFLISLGSAVAVEYVLGDKDPAAKLQQQRRIRYAALEAMFRLYSTNAPREQRAQAASSVGRLAIAGQSGMMALYNAIVEKNGDTGTLPIAIRPRITMLAQLMDNAAAFGLQNPSEVDADTQARCLRLADECKRLILGIPPAPSEGLRLGPAGAYTLIDRVEGALHAILTMPISDGTVRSRELVALPSSKVPFFIPGALRSGQSVAFALKISLCATFCYILYHALAWPGIATTVTTVLVTGLSSTGAIKQKLVFRVLGSIVGGLILAIGATVFLFPHMDSITSLVVLVAVIAFISAWITGGPKFNYIGLQIAFSFYIVAFEGFSAPTELAPARDRLAGILIALAVMLFVFDLLWPVRTTTVMRASLAAVLRLGAALFMTMNTAAAAPNQEQTAPGQTERIRQSVTMDRAALLHHADGLRSQIGRAIAGLRSMNGSVAYEFGADREQHIQAGDLVLRAAITAAALFWNQLTVLHNPQDADFLSDPGLAAMRTRLATRMGSMANVVAHPAAPTLEHPGAVSPPAILTSADTGSKIMTREVATAEITDRVTVDPAVFVNPRFAEYVRNTAARFEELQNFTAILGQHVSPQAPST